MRIALYHNLPSGGAKRAVYEWTQRLCKNHDIDVYTLSTADHNFCDIRPLVNEHYVFDFTPHELFKSPNGRLNQIQRWRDLGELITLGQHIAKKIDSNHYDVVFAHPCINTLIPALLNYVTTPSLYYLHEPFSKYHVEISRPYIQSKGWRERLDRVDPLISLYHRRLGELRDKSIRHTTLLLANSNYTKNQIKLNYDLEAHLCYLGANSQIFYPLKDVEKKDYIISVGELTPRKGFNFLIESLGYLPSAKRPCLMLVSNMQNSAERVYIEDLAAQHDVSLQILSALSTEQLRQAYNSALLCVYSPVKEPFGLVPLEAMACGIPVIGVAEGGVCETVLDGVTGRLVERDPAKFAEAMRLLLEDSALRQQYGQQARQHVLEQWNWEQSVANLEQYLQQVAWSNPAMLQSNTE
jgi:glycosyltransferase involved in cell wall biosynthesis